MFICLTVRQPLCLPEGHTLLPAPSTCYKHIIGRGHNTFPNDVLELFERSGSSQQLYALALLRNLPNPRSHTSRKQMYPVLEERRRQHIAHSACWAAHPQVSLPQGRLSVWGSICWTGAWLAPLQSLTIAFAQATSHNGNDQNGKAGGVELAGNYHLVHIKIEWSEKKSSLFQWENNDGWSDEKLVRIQERNVQSLLQLSSHNSSIRFSHREMMY